MTAPASAPSLDRLKTIISQHWGYQSFRPLQESAMRAVLAGRDSLVVLPTGAGKSLCYQAPAVVRGDTTVVVSPLISLMKDQVDSLLACGVPAVAINSSMHPGERGENENRLLQGEVRLLFVSPERLVMPSFQQTLRQANIRNFAIDEAHCISHWGHQFRPEYRQLNQLKQIFPEAVVHAYTATATERVRQDIIAQLSLRQPEVLVGNFDRPNLTYRVVPRHNLMDQVREVLDRHKNEAGIIYCISRKNVDELTAALKDQGYHALPYHAGLNPDQRLDAQSAFSEEKCDLIVATVAFGMGIDRSNIRFVLHTGMPKSVEHYQQETGRAGRDGLEAECVLLFSGADTMTWKRILEKSANEPGVDPSFLPVAKQHLAEMDNYARGSACRHRGLVTYFGQSFEKPSCQACDICLGDAEPVPEALVIAQKILSCVARVEERFGAGHVVSVLRGENTEKITKYQHERLSTFGLLHDHDPKTLKDWVHQLVSQDVLVQTADEYPILKLNPASWEVMKGKRPVRLLQRTQVKETRKSKTETTSWEGVDRTLFEVLRGLRQRLADEKGWPPYVVFSDNTLRELARVRPSTPEQMRQIYGVGDAKLRDFGQTFLQTLRDYCRKHNLTMDVAAPPPEKKAAEKKPATAIATPAGARVFGLFQRKATIEEAMQHLGRARSTVVGYLCQFIEEARPPSLAPWVADELYQRIAPVARQYGLDRLRPIYLALNEQVAYDDIRLVVTHLRAEEGIAASDLDSADGPRRLTPLVQAEQERAFALFRRGTTIEEVMQRTGWVRAKVVDYLCDLIRQDRPASIGKWVDDTIYRRVIDATRGQDVQKLRPVHQALNEEVSYDDIRLVLAHQASQQSP